MGDSSASAKVVAAPAVERQTFGERRWVTGVRRQLGEFLFVLPVLVLIGTLLLIPTANALFHSLTNWNPGSSSPYVGLKNYLDLAQSTTFHEILKNQGILLLAIPVWTLVPLALSLALYENVPAPGLFRTIYFFPAAVSPAIIGVLFSVILAPNGPLNSAIRAAAPDSFAQNWLLDPRYVLVTIMVVFGWAMLGTGVVIFSAALSTVPPALFEAARLDGAGWWQRLWHLVIPSLRRIIQLWAVILILTAFLGMFPWVFTLTRGGPGYSSTTMDYDIYQNALQFGYFGVASAEAVYVFVIVALVILVGGRLFGRERGVR
jgi:ABC-type sugar transport system permease subunit